MQKLAALVITSFLATPAFANWLTPVAGTICTRDFNPWGQASICQCPEDTRYENRLGQCVQSEPVEVTVEGFIAPELNLDGDIVAYRMTKNEQESFKVVLPWALRSKFESKEFQGIQFRIQGEVYENLANADRNAPTLIVEKIEPLDIILEDLIPNNPELSLVID